MKLEKQVCSQELAKRLKELGVKQESLYYWWQQCNKVHQGYEDDIYPPEYIWVLQPYFKGLALGDNTYSAFTTSEIGEMLPDAYISFKESNIWYCTQLEEPDEEWWLDYRIRSRSYGWRNEKADTEADARATMLIWLIENKHIEVNNEKS